MSTVVRWLKKFSGTMIKVEELANTLQVCLDSGAKKVLLEGKKTLVRGLKGKKGSYDAYLIPEGIEDYSYIKDGKEIKGSQYKFKMEFPPRKSK